MSTAIFDWDKDLELAEELVRRRGDPAPLRSAISRASYAAFHRASGFYVGRGERPTFTGEDHALVWDWFAAQASDQRLRLVGSLGYRLRQARRRADYDAAGFPLLSTETDRWVRIARQIVTALHESA